MSVAAATSWDPLQLGPTRLEQRIVMPPHGPHYGEDDQPSERMIACFAERARGGAAVLSVEATWGWRAGGGLREPARHVNPITTWERRVIPAFARLADAEYVTKAREARTDEIVHNVGEMGYFVSAFVLNSGSRTPSTQPPGASASAATARWCRRHERGGWRWSAAIPAACASRP